jgi:hypothetical protein
MESIGINIVVSVVTAFLTYIVIEYVKKSGKISVNLGSSELALNKLDVGVEVPSSVAEATSLTVILGLDIYNSSDVQRSLRALEIELKPKNKSKSFVSPPYTFIRGSTSYSPYGKFQVINLPPKEITHLDVRCWASGDECRNLGKDVSIYLKGLYPSGRKFRAFLQTIDLERLS